MRLRKLCPGAREFYGIPAVQMLFLVNGKDEVSNLADVPRVPASFAYILERRMNAPEDVRKEWHNTSFFTGDGSVAGKKGDNLIVLDAKYLRELHPKSKISDGALSLPAYAWNELKAQKENVFYLTPNEVREAGQGYIEKDGVWTPANKTVAKVWDILSRGQDLTPYIQSLSKTHPSFINMLTVHLNHTTKDGKPTMRPFIASHLGGASAYNSNLYASGACLVGIDPMASLDTRDSLERKVA